MSYFIAMGDTDSADQIESQSSTETQTPSTQEVPKSHRKDSVEQEVEEVPGSVSSSISEELLQRITALCEKQSDTIISLEKKIQEQDEKLQQLTIDVDSHKIFESKGTITGVYDYSKAKDHYDNLIKPFTNDEGYARELYDKIRLNNRGI